MFKKIFCRETEFEKFMLAYANNIEKAAREFSLFVHGFDPARIVPWVEKIKAIEHDCDDITHATMNWLEGTFIVDYDREDIHALASDLDDIVDFIDAAATRISLYNVKEMMPEVVLLTEKMELACRETAKAIRAISGPKLSRDVLEICKNIKTYESDGDHIYHDTLATLFKGEHDPMYVIKFKEIVEEIERALDRCNKSAMNVESIIFKYG